MNFFQRLLLRLRAAAPAPPPAGGLDDADLDGPPPRPAKPPKPGAGKLDLAAPDFTPIARDQMLDEAGKLGRGWDPWQGRRDRIPPADDPRTNLIDRAMVAHGLLTPEELAEIHAVGDEMDRVRPTIEATRHRLQRAGEDAVAADRAERARIRERKKAEAASNARRRAERIARRKATDIVFLGRGVSGRLGDRESRPEALERLGLPVMSQPAELAEALGISVPRLRWLAFHSEAATRTHYVAFTVPKRGGGVRHLSAPHRSLALAQRWVFENVVARLPVSDQAHGFVAGRGIVSNARPHAGQALVVNLDLKDFFPSIHFPRVRKVFERAGYSPAVATVLALLCTESPRRPVTYDGTPYHVATGPRALPQGACTSPGLSNQVALRLDRRLAGLAAKLGLAYTRYADDLTFSGGPDFEGRVGYLLARVRHVAADEGFAVHEAKTRVLRRNAAQAVTGLVVNDRPGVPRDEVRRLRAILHRARAEGLDAQNREGRPDVRAWLRGKIAFVAMARPEVGARLLAEFEAILDRERDA